MVRSLLIKGKIQGQPRAAHPMQRSGYDSKYRSRSLYRLRQLHENPDFRWTATCGNDWKHEPADWVETKYQRKAIREGRRPVFLDFERL
mgnify:CR=1 FL=1